MRVYFHYYKAWSYDHARFQLHVSRVLNVEVHPCKPIIPTPTNDQKRTPAQSIQQTNGRKKKES